MATFFSLASAKNPIHWLSGAKKGSLAPSVPESGVGEVEYVARGSRYNGPARSEDGRPLPRGTQALIVRVEEGVCVVKPSIEERFKRLGAGD